MRIPELLLVSAGFFAVIAVSSVAGAEFTYHYQKIIDIAQPVMLQLNLVRGNVRVSGVDSDKMIIEAVKRVRASNEGEAEEVADHIEIRVDRSPADVIVSTNYLRLFNRSPSFWQKVFGAGSDSYGAVDYTIALPLGSSVQIHSMAADIELSNIEGSIKVDNTVGRTRGEFLIGAVTVSQPQGVIDLRWVEGDIRLKSSSGRIRIEQSRGAIDLATLTGDVKIKTELDSPREYFIETSSGSITFLIPEGSSGVLNVETESGEVKTEMPVAIRSVSRNRLIGEFGQGGPSIRLCSSSGDVTVAVY